VLGERAVDVDLLSRLVVGIRVLGVEVEAGEDRPSMPFFWPKYMSPSTGSIVQKFLPVLARRPT
jgi:hypothetical protein